MLSALKHGKHKISKNLIMISLDWTRPKDPPLSLGHASILANLYANKINVTAKSWAVNNPSFRVEEVLQYIENVTSMDHDLAFGVFIWNEQYVQNVIKHIKKNNFPGRIILGGPQISYVKNDIENYYPEADIFIRGYGEEALAKYMLSKEPFPVIQGVHFAGQSDLHKSATADLNNIPSPFLSGVLQRQRFMRWETQRGCPFRCSFCQHRESDVSQKRRAFPARRIEQEIDWLTEDKEVQDLAVLDPVFNSGSQYLSVLERFAMRQYSGKIALQCRMEMVKPEFLDVVEEVNKTGRVVLEFGLQTIHKNEQKLIQRPNAMPKIREVLDETRRRKIETEVSLIFGLPGQTVESFKASIDFCKSFEVPVIHAFPLMLLRGTPLHEKKEQLNMVESNDTTHLEATNQLPTDSPYVVKSGSFSYDDWLRMSEMADELETNYNLKQPFRP